jgi:GDP-4-dehydro-6-deoxy-D-mannose reductase
MRDAACLAKTLRRAKPDTVYHLAATTSVSEGEADPKGTMEVNLTGTLHLLEAIRKEAPGARLVHVSSSEVYGRVPAEENPIREDRIAAPVHLYGLSKLLSEELVRFYQEFHGICAAILRPFNHIGPGQSDRFVCASLARQIASIELGRADPILRLGNLDPVRDFTDVRDTVEAYRLAAEFCPSGSIHNIASGQGTSIADLLGLLLALTGARIEVREDPDRVRKTDIPVLVGDTESFSARTGWQRRYPLRETLSDTLAYWRRREADPRTD